MNNDIFFKLCRQIQLDFIICVYSTSIGYLFKFNRAIKYKFAKYREIIQ